MCASAKPTFSNFCTRYAHCATMSSPIAIRTDTLPCVVKLKLGRSLEYEAQDWPVFSSGRSRGTPYERIRPAHDAHGRGPYARRSPRWFRTSRPQGGRPHRHTGGSAPRKLARAVASPATSAPLSGMCCARTWASWCGNEAMTKTSSKLTPFPPRRSPNRSRQQCYPVRLQPTLGRPRRFSGKPCKPNGCLDHQSGPECRTTIRSVESPTKPGGSVAQRSRRLPTRVSCRSAKARP